MEEYEKQLLKKINESREILEMSAHELTNLLRESIIGADGASLKHHLLRLSSLEILLTIAWKSKKIGNPMHILLTFHIPSNVPLPRLSSPLFPMEEKLKRRTLMPRVKCLTEVNMLTQLFSTPKYNELIPSIFMFSTVPFLFGMMFSDIGHGLLLVVAAWLFKLSPLFYFMGAMSVYCGFIYN